MNVKKGDFIELDFVGRTKINDKVFDLTVESVAKKEGLEAKDLKPLVICIGEKFVPKGLDQFLVDKEIGKEYEVDITPENAFGKRIPKLLKLTTLDKFREHEVMPAPGMTVTLDGTPCLIRSVSGGRVIVDFNHPLAGKTLHYWLKINKKITDDKVKLENLTTLLMGQFKKDITISEGTAKIKLEDVPELPKVMTDKFESEVKRLIPTIKKVEFIPEKKLA